MLPSVPSTLAARWILVPLVLLLTHCQSPPSTDTPTDDSDTSVLPVSERLDPDCLDGQYTEVLADPEADISDLQSAFSSDEAVEFLLDALDRRYPVGAVLLEGGMENTGMMDCLQVFMSPSDSSSSTSMLEAASTLVHECGHMYNIALSSFTDSTFVITEDLSFSCGGGYMDDTFARSLINLDEFSALRPPCPSTGAHGCDDYAALYLDGDPTDSQFDSGDQGLDMLMEEVIQYINSLATDYAFYNEHAWTVSARDGLLTFLWYMERYLHTARTQYPDIYNEMMNNTCYVDLILTAWGRSWLFLDATETIDALGIDDHVILPLVDEPILLDEIDRVRTAKGCL